MPTYLRHDGKSPARHWPVEDQRRFISKIIGMDRLGVGVGFLYPVVIF